MAKIKISYYYLLCFIISINAFSQNTVAEEYTPEEIRACVKELFDSQVGVREEGSNRGAYVELYLESVGLEAGLPYCAAFVSWCYQNAGVQAPISGWVPSFSRKANRIYQRGRFQKKTPQTADVFLIWYPSLNRPAHIGFIDQWDSSWIITVEGNTNDNGSREGDGVYRKRRLKKQIWVVSNFIDPPLINP